MYTTLVLATGLRNRNQKAKPVKESKSESALQPSREPNKTNKITQKPIPFRYSCQPPISKSKEKLDIVMYCRVLDGSF
jgi:hypothetical protein